MESGENAADGAGESLAEIFQTELDDLCTSIENDVQNNDLDAFSLSVHQECVHEAIQHVRGMGDVLSPQDQDSSVRRLVELRGRIEQLERDASRRALPQHWVQGNRNAWSLDLDTDLLLELTELRFTDEETANFLNCSRSTVQRRRAALGLRKRNQTEITHEQLCELVLEIRRKGTE